jgi:hypothetical protein
MSRPIVVDLDDPDAEQLERLWDELRARHAADESARMHLQRQARTRELLLRTVDRAALGAFQRAAAPEVRAELLEGWAALTRDDPAATLGALVQLALGLGFSVSEAVQIGVAHARFADVGDAEAAPVLALALKKS